MEENSAAIGQEDSMSVRSGGGPGSTGARSPPSLSPVMTSAGGCPVSPSSPPPPPLLTAPPSLAGVITGGHHHSGPSPPGCHSPPMFPSPPPTSRPSCPPFLPALYFSHAYNSPPPIHTSDPTANDCKLIDYRGQKIAAFIISSETMLCLPQAFELFLKNLVGGLHTVYTKLKRLGIEPIVCNVEQVRVLRGLGAIQPGVNRCKLLSMKHFDVLYKDCTTARLMKCYRISSFGERPGRPPKRPHEILGVGGFPPPMGPGGLPPPHLSPEALMALKKTRMDPRDFPPFMNGAISHAGLQGGDGELEKSPLLNNGYNPPPKSLMAQYMALNGGMPHPALLAHTAGLPLPPNPTPWTSQHGPDHPFKPQPHPENIARSMVWENCRASYDEVLKHLERIREDRSRADRVLGLERDDHQERPQSPNYPKINGYGEPDVLNLSSKSDSRDDLSDPPTPRDNRDDKDDNLSDGDDIDDKNDLSYREDFDYPSGALQTMYNNNNTSITNNNNSLSNGGVIGSLLGSFSSSSGVTPTTSTISSLQNKEDRVPGGLVGLAGNSEGGSHPPLSSLENLLGNIQNLLKVAAESVRHEEKNWIREKEHLRLEFMRQKEMRERLEKQLMEDEKVKLLYLRKLKKEKRARRRLEEELTEKLKRLSQYEPNAKELLRAAAESLAKEGAKTQNVNTAIAAAAAAAAAAVSSAGGTMSSVTGPVGGAAAGDRTGPGQDSAVTTALQQRLSPKNNNNLHQQDMDQRTQQQNDDRPPGPGVYFNKSLQISSTLFA